MAVNLLSSISSPIGFSNFSGLRGVNSLSSTLASTTNRGFLGPLGGSNPVTFSGTGQLLSAIDNFQSRLTTQKPSSTSSGLGQHFGTDFGSLIAETQNFSNVFNRLSNRLDGLYGPFGALAGDPRVTQLYQTLGEQALASFDNGSSPLTRLAEIGINYQAPFKSLGGGALSLDLDTLQSAFATDPSGSFSLLLQAEDSFGSMAADFFRELSSAAAAFGGTGNYGLSSLFSSNAQNFSGLLSLASLRQPKFLGGGFPFSFGNGYSGGIGGYGGNSLFSSNARDFSGLLSLASPRQLNILGSGFPFSFDNGYPERVGRGGSYFLPQGATGSGNSSINTGFSQHVLALNQYNMVSLLLG